MNSINLVQKAKALPKAKRKDILLNIRETKLHEYLKELFNNLSKDYNIEITHGNKEYGKDLVLYKDEPWGEDCIGVLVHCGNIKGKTVGAVDKINSQISQAFSHSIQLKEKIKAINISKLLIILNGSFSRNAIERIEGENKDNKIELLDINWLVNQFTSNYPQIFFEGELVDFLQIEIENFEFCDFFKKIGKNLSECYVEPLIGTFQLPEKIDENSILKIIESQRVNFSEFSSIIEKYKKIILIGDPGSGKTLALKKIALDRYKKATIKLTSGKRRKKIPISLFIKASDFQDIMSFKSLLEFKFKNKNLISNFVIDSIMIDGLDEVLHEKRLSILESATKISKEKNISVIITSRKIDILETPPSGYQIFELLPFEVGQAIKLFTKLIKDKQLLSSLKEGILDIQDKLIMNPLSLTLLIELVKSYKEIPASITELYERFTDLIFGRYDKEKGIETIFNYIVKKKFMSEFTYNEFYKKNRMEVPLSDYNDFLDKYVTKFSWDKKKLEEFTREIERAGLIGIDKFVYFRHKTFLDFFIALHIFDNRENIDNLEPLISKLHYSDIWEDVAFFYVGHKREISIEILDIIFSKKEDDIFIILDKLLIGRLLQAAWHSNNETKFHGISKAVNYIPAFREKLESISLISGKNIPKIFLDFLVVLFSEFSFRSFFLFNVSKEVFYSILNNPNKNSPIILMSLLASHFNKLEKKERDEMINKILETSDKFLSIEDQARTLFSLLIIERKDKDKSLKKTLERRLRKILKKYPSLYKNLLPNKRKGFR